MGQVITPVWVQRLAPWGTQGNGSNSTVIIGTDPTNQFPLLAGSRPEPNNNEDGSEIQPTFTRLQRYDANRMILFIPENGINETASMTPEQAALAAAYPDRSAVWVDANSGRSLGLAWYGGLHPALNCIPPYNVQDPATGNQYASYDPVYTFYFQPALDEGPPGQKALYDGVNHVILRYAPLPDGSGWTNVPTIAYQENVPGIGDGLSGAGDDFRRWRWRNFRVTGWGTNTVIMGGGGTWRTGMHAQKLVTTDGLNFHPIGRIDDRSGGLRNNYAGEGNGSRVVKYGTDPANPNTEVYFTGHYPAYAYNSETPERYVSDYDRFWPGASTVTNYNQQPWVAMFESTPGLTNPVALVDSLNPLTITNNLPLFLWEETSKNGLVADTANDNINWYAGAWSMNTDTHPDLDYIVSISTPSWNNAMPVRTYGWIAIHRLDGSIASGPNSAYCIPLKESDVRVPGNGGDGLVGDEACYNCRVEVNPIAGTDPKLKMAEVTATFGPLGFGVFIVSNMAANIDTQPPSSLTVVEGANVTISPSISGSPNTYLWTKGGAGLNSSATNADGSVRYPYTLFAGTTHSTLMINEVKVADSGSYALSITNPVNGAMSTAPTVLTVLPDTNKPTVLSVTGLGTPGAYGSGPWTPFAVKVLFSKRMDPTTAGDYHNYTIAGVNVNTVTLQSTPAGASLGGDWREAIVATAGLTPGQTYTLHIQNLKDQAATPNTINPVDVEFIVPVRTQGRLEWSYYYVGAPPSGTTFDINYLYASTLWPIAPMTNGYSTSFDTTPITGGDLNSVKAFGVLGDYYGDSLSGWVTPTVTTNYDFFLASDDDAELYLNPNGSDPSQAYMVASSGCCPGFQEPGNP